MAHAEAEQRRGERRRAAVDEHRRDRGGGVAGGREAAAVVPQHALHARQRVHPLDSVRHARARGAAGREADGASQVALRRGGHVRDDLSRRSQMRRERGRVAAVGVSPHVRQGGAAAPASWWPRGSEQQV